ncbi:MAG: hypothetical protein EOM20_01140 [Spartobacteria bacterium]|nr:hypothetical protein [Spartobacteria bacterium]
MIKRHFLKSMLALSVGVPMLVLLGGCIAPRVSPDVSESKAQPWRCEHCGHLTRSDADLTDARCPRCMRKKVMKKITEAQLQEYLKAES